MGARAVRRMANRLAAWLLHRFTEFRVVAWTGDREKIAGIGISNCSKTYASPGRWVMIDETSKPVSLYGISYHQASDAEKGWINLHRHDKAN
jgi:hypothetical protein